MKKIIALYFILFSAFGFSQNREKLRLKKYQIAVLPDSVKESSGLDFFGEKLYTFNDSGNTSELFEIDKKSGKILKTLKTNLRNKDWEALTNDGENFYIGDFGNNAGTRKDLIIYKIPFAKDSLSIDSVKNISFYFPEQKSFIPENLNTDFDVESMIFLNGKIHVFTKEWKSKSVTHYTIDPEITENQPAEKTEIFKTGFSVTDAAYFNGKLFLVGYTKGAKVFLEIFNETQPGIFFSGKSEKYFLGTAFSIGQIEGIAVGETGIYFSGEAFHSPLGRKKQRFYFVPKEKF